MTNHKNIPHDNEAEKVILGLIIRDDSLLDETASILTPESFFTVAHQHIYRSILELAKDSHRIDEITLGNQLKLNKQLTNAGGYTYLAELVETAPASANIVYYAKIIREHALIRELISITSEIGQKCRNPEQSISELLSETESKIAKISNRSSDSSYTHIKNIVSESYRKLAEASEKNSEITGLPTGFIDIDKMTSGLQPSDLIILAARPSMGKTALAMNIASYVAGNTEIKGAVMIFSLEMSKEQLAMRLLASESQIDSKKLRSGQLETDDWDKLADAAGKISEMQIYINDASNISPYELIASTKQLHKELGDLSLVVVDYLQLMQIGKINMIREQAIAEISRSLKGLAKELNIPVIALSQLNRTVESRPNKRPQLSDLRESGSLEQDADIIMFIYRDEVYNDDSPDKGIAEIHIAKHRNGPTGKRNLAFVGKHTTFANLSTQYQ